MKALFYKMKSFFLAFYFLLIVNSGIAQTGSSSGDSIRTTAHSIYLEIGGSGGFGSVNYQQFIFQKKELAIAARIGISSYHLKDFQNKFNPDLLLPISFKALYGKTHKAEIGIGETFTSVIYASETNSKPKRELTTHTHFILGYLYQQPKGGIIAGIAYTPILELNRHFRHWVGISIGYSF